jgi:hypothetical protein
MCKEVKGRSIVPVSPTVQGEARHSTVHSDVEQRY